MVYARYATEPGREVIALVRELEHAEAAVVTDCGMQATAIVQDVLLKPKSHALMSRQVYNKTRAYLNWLSQRMEVEPQIVDELTPEVLEREVKPNTSLVLAETFTNPIVRTLNPQAISDTIVKLREERAPGLRMVVDNTIVSPWGTKNRCSTTRVLMRSSRPVPKHSAVKTETCGVILPRTRLAW